MIFDGKTTLVELLRLNETCAVLSKDSIKTATMELSKPSTGFKKSKVKAKAERKR
jgi:hypothetical protein